jgi:D-cysteine desulfhydrase/L-cysteate sulfo-lyase
VLDVAARAAKLIGTNTVLTTEDFTITEDQIAPGYGRPSPDSLAAVRLAGGLAGLILDPVYTGKAMAGLIAAVRTGLIPQDAHVAFLHSGGTPGLFHHAQAFAS